MMTRFKITAPMLEHARRDLRRPHLFAAERVGFILCRFARVRRSSLLILAFAYHPVRDDDYIEDSRFGALIGSNAFRMAMQLAWQQHAGLFHVHLHDHHGVPHPSRIDVHESSLFVPDFFHVQPKLPHGTLILSHNAMSGVIWRSTSGQTRAIERFDVVGRPFLLGHGLDA